MELDDVLKPYLKNFRQLFFSKTKHGEERLSVVKLALVGVYLLANILAFFQFSTVSTSVLQKRSQSVGPGEESVLDYQIPMTIYGTLAHYLNFVVLIGALFFLITQDKPLSVLVQQLRDWASQSRLHFIGLIVGISVISVYTLTRLGSFSLSSLAIDLSYEMGLGMNYAWWTLQPVLFLGGSLLLINTYIKVDESFKARFGDLTKPTKKTAILLMVDLLIIVIIFVIADSIFHVTLATGENPGVITRVVGVGFYQWTIFWLLIHFTILATFTVFNMLVLFFLYVLRRPRSEVALILGILFVSLVLFTLITTILSFPPITTKFLLLIILLLLVIFYGAPLLTSFIVYLLNRSREYLSSRTALIPWILFVGLFLTVLKVAPAILVLEGRIKSLSNWLDALGLFFTLFLGIIRVTTVSERPELEKSTDSHNPLKLIKRIRIPAYSRVLILFYLAFIGFYLTLETHTISVILNIQNDFRVLRLQILAFTSSFGFLYVFWRYKPLKGQKVPPFTG